MNKGAKDSNIKVIEEQPEGKITPSMKMATVKMMRRGVSRKKIQDLMAKEDIPLKDSKELIDQLATTLHNDHRRMMTGGVIWGIIGIALSIFLFTKAAGSPPLIAYIVFWGLAVIGIYDFIRGMIGFSRTKQY